MDGMFLANPGAEEFALYIAISTWTLCVIAAGIVKLVSWIRSKR